MPEPSKTIDVALIGGGITGLWLINHLQRCGHQALLFARPPLGGEQTLASQGIIHGGLKYMLGSGKELMAPALKAMPETWRACLRGEGPVDLRQTLVNNENLLLWSAAGLSGRLASLAAGQLVRGRVQPIPYDERPAALKTTAIGDVAACGDFVLDIPSLVRNLASHADRRIVPFSGDTLQVNDSGVALKLPGSGEPIRARHLVLCAGSGNAELLKQLAPGLTLTQPAMQLRPLRQVMVQEKSLPELYGHQLGKGARPAFTVTTHRRDDGSPVWYLGGELAEQGAGQDVSTSLQHAKSALSSSFPDINWENATWSSVLIARAEPLTRARRPESSYCQELGTTHGTRISLLWPTKLTLVPALAEQLTAELAPPCGQGDLSDWRGSSCWEFQRPPWENPA